MPDFFNIAVIFCLRYSAVSRCAWNFTAKNPGDVIILNFTDFDVQVGSHDMICDADWVEIADGKFQYLSSCTDPVLFCL